MNCCCLNNNKELANCSCQVEKTDKGLTINVSAETNEQVDLLHRLADEGKACCDEKCC